MTSRAFTQVLLIVLTGAVIYIAWQLTRAGPTGAGPEVGQPGLLSLEEAVANSRSSTVRSNAVISVESCKKARNEFLRDAPREVPATATPEEIEALLQSMLAQLTGRPRDDTHLTCLLHQVPVAARSKPS